LRDVLSDAAGKAIDLAAAQVAHHNAVEMLDESTSRGVAAASGRVTGLAEGWTSPQLSATWDKQVGHDGPLADLVQACRGGEAAETTAEQRKSWVDALADFTQEVSDAAASASGPTLSSAWEALVELWTGDTVPVGTRELVQSAGLIESRTDEMADRMAGEWRKQLVAALGMVLSPPGSASPVAPEGLATLIQAAALGATGAKELVTALVGSGAEQVFDEARRTFALAEAEAVTELLAPFGEAVRGCDCAASARLAWAAERLTAATRGVDG
jgi:hypothetical protein